MQHSLDEAINEYGFTFFEKLHSPIFLITRSGSLSKVNEAGRKLLRIAHLSQEQLTTFFQQIQQTLAAPLPKVEVFRVLTRNNHLKVVLKKLSSGDILIELVR